VSFPENYTGEIALSLSDIKYLSKLLLQKNNKHHTWTRIQHMHLWKCTCTLIPNRAISYEG